MYKKLPAFLLLTLLLTNCKKENKVQLQLPDVTGTWALYSHASVQGSAKLYYDSGTYPCLAGNLFVISSNGTTKAYYTGTNTCYLGNPASMGYSFAIGVPGQDTLRSQWSSKNDLFVLKYTNSNGSASYSYGRVNTVNNKEQLSIRDTANYFNQPYISTDIFQKQ